MNVGAHALVNVWKVSSQLCDVSDLFYVGSVTKLESPSCLASVFIPSAILPIHLVSFKCWSSCGCERYSS